MFKKNKILLAFIPFFSLPSFASEDLKELEMGVYADLHYDFSDYEYEDQEIDVDTESRFANTNIGFYSNYLVRDDLELSLDLGVSNHADFIYGSVYKDEFDFVANKVFLTYQYNENLDVEVGRMFTPIGLFHNDPTHKNNIIDNSNPLSRYSDAINIRYQSESEGINYNVNGFAATHLDDSRADNHLGFNVIIGNSDIGNFSVGFAQYKLDISEIEIEYFEGGYYLERDSFDFIVNGKHLKDLEEREHNFLDTKFRYNLFNVKPFIQYHSLDVQEYEDEELPLYSFQAFGGGVEFDLNKNILLSVKYERYDYNDEDFDESQDVFTAGLSFRI